MWFKHFWSLLTVAIDETVVTCLFVGRSKKKGISPLLWHANLKLNPQLKNRSPLSCVSYGLLIENWERERERFCWFKPFQWKRSLLRLFVPPSVRPSMAFSYSFVTLKSGIGLEKNTLLFAKRLCKCLQYSSLFKKYSYHTYFVIAFFSVPLFQIFVFQVEKLFNVNLEKSSIIFFANCLE